MKTRFCINCGKKIGVNQKFCPYCGTKQPKPNRLMINHHHNNFSPVSHKIHRHHNHPKIKRVVYSILGLAVLFILVVGGIRLYKHHTQVTTARDVTKYLGSNNLFSNVHYNKKDNTANLDLSNKGKNYYLKTKLQKKVMDQEQSINTRNMNYHDFQYDLSDSTDPQDTLSSVRQKINDFNPSFKLRTNISPSLTKKYTKLNKSTDKKTWNNTVAKAKNIFLKKYNNFNRVIPDRKHNVIEVNFKHSLYNKINVKSYCTNHDYVQEHIHHIHIPICDNSNSSEYIANLAKTNLPSNISRDTYKLGEESNNLGVRVVVTARTPSAHITIHRHGGLIGKEYTDGNKLLHSKSDKVSKAEYNDRSLNHKAGYLRSGSKRYPKVIQEIYVNGDLYEAKLNNGKYIKM